MINPKEIKGIMFDFGGTLDTDGCHWAMKIWHAYEPFELDLSLEQYREVYVYAERTMAKHNYVNPHDSFFNMLSMKLGLQMDFISRKVALDISNIHDDNPDGNKVWEDVSCESLFCSADDAAIFADNIAKEIYEDVKMQMVDTREILAALHPHFPMVLVSNFYGNLNTVLKEFEIDGFFKKVVESEVVGKWKPDPSFFMEGVKALDFKPENIVMVGDSLDKDIVPAHEIGCKTVWLKGEGWKDQPDSDIPDAVVNSISELPRLFEIT